MKTHSPAVVLARAERLCRDYIVLASLMRDLASRAETGDWKICDDAWEDFSRALEGHLAFEENEVFPLYVASGRADPRLVLRARAAHDEIRREALRLGVELQLHLLRPRRLRAFLDTVRERTGREVRAICDWAESRPDGGGLRGLLSRAAGAMGLAS
jgi:hypothetical protein